MPKAVSWRKLRFRSVTKISGCGACDRKGWSGAAAPRFADWSVTSRSRQALSYPTLPASRAWSLARLYGVARLFVNFFQQRVHDFSGGQTGEVVLHGTDLVEQPQ